MKPTIKNRIKLWWHCLIHLHREVRVGKGNAFWFIITSISCSDCDYGSE